MTPTESPTIPFSATARRTMLSICAAVTSCDPTGRASGATSATTAAARIGTSRDTGEAARAISVTSKPPSQTRITRHHRE
jgi:hypothetical protein